MDLSLDRDGEPRSVVHFQGGLYVDLRFNSQTLILFINSYCSEWEGAFPPNTIVVDGMSQKGPAQKLGGAAKHCGQD